MILLIQEYKNGRMYTQYRTAREGGAFLKFK